MLKFGERWNTGRWAACSAMIGMAWMADEPVPMMPPDALHALVVHMQALGSKQRREAAITIAAVCSP
jgi:hypothetical protein